MKPTHKVPGLSDLDIKRLEAQKQRLEQEYRGLQETWKHTSAYKAYQLAEREWSQFMAQLNEKGQDLYSMSEAQGEKITQLNQKIETTLAKARDTQECRVMMEKKNAIHTLNALLARADDQENLKPYLQRLSSETLKKYGIFQMVEPLKQKFASGETPASDVKHGQPAGKKN